MEKKEKKALNLRTILIIVLALIVLGEGIFLLTHRKGGSTAANDSAAASGAPADGQDHASGDGQPAAEASSAPDAAAESGNDKQSSGTDPKASDKQDASEESGKAPVQTPPVEIPPENKSKAYAGAVGALSNYIKSPSAATLAYVLGGEFAGDQMQRFLPALFTMSGGSEEMLRAELTADLDIPEGTASLTIAGEKALSKEELQSASQKLQDMKLSFSSMGDLADQVKSFSDADWEAFGAQLNLTGPQAKELLMELTGSADTIASRLTDAKISEGYQVTLKSDTGASTVTNVYCINGKWVTSAFFDMQFS